MILGNVSPRLKLVFQKSHVL